MPLDPTPQAPIIVVNIDDDAIVLFLHRMLLKKFLPEDSIMSYKDPAEAVEAIKHLLVAARAAVVLILLDINMPKMSGWEILEELRQHEQGRSFSVAMVTSSINTADKERARTFPEVIKFLEKPLSSEDCAELLKDIELHL